MHPRTPYNLAWKKKNKERSANIQRRARRKKRLAKYGITQIQYTKLLEIQGGVCWLCRKPPVSRNLHVDHCHETKRVRGLACYSCNRLRIGVAKDSEWELYKRISEYLHSRFDGRQL